MTLVLLLGGARSGKSSLAVELAQSRTTPVVYVATGTRSDEEMAVRIERHRRERPAAWRTIEESRDLAGVLADVEPEATVVVDCLSRWASNLLEGEREDEIVARAVRDATLFAARSGLTLAVSNEVGLGLVPMHPVGRAYRDVLGRVNAAWADAAHAVYLVVAGRVLPLDRLTFDA